MKNEVARGGGGGGGGGKGCKHVRDLSGKRAQLIPEL